MYTAKYISTGKPDYYKTVHADSVNEATIHANRFKRKCYQLVTVTKADSRKD